MEISFLFECGKGLEDIARQELIEKGSGQNFSIHQMENKGFIQVNFNDSMRSNENKLMFFSTIRCFENIYFILNVQPNILRPNRNGYQDIGTVFRQFFEETIDIFLQKDRRELLHQLFPDSKIDFTMIEIAAPIPPFLRGLGIDQRTIQGIAKKVLIHHALKPILHQDHTFQIRIMNLSKTFMALVRIPLPAGNLPLLHPHPTGLFPNYAYGLIFKSIQIYKTKNTTLKKDLCIIDPMTGAATIPILICAELQSILNKLDSKDQILQTWGYEIEPNFFESGKKNIEDYQFQNAIQIRNIDFNTDKSDLKADLIITQPPYGFSIKMTENDLTQLYQNFFNWALNHSFDTTLIAVITPHKTIIQNLRPKIEWDIIDESPIREHSLDVFYLILQRKNK